jgi:hypothetical protein
LQKEKNVGRRGKEVTINRVEEKKGLWGQRRK